MKQDRFPNGVECFLETHFEVSCAIGAALSKEGLTGLPKRRYEEQGTGGMYELAQELTTKFENQYKDVLWGKDLEFFETIEGFLNKELYEDN